MREQNSYDYAVIRVVPRVEREEFLNVGVIVYCRVMKYLAARIAFDPARLAHVFPDMDLDEVERHLAQIPLISSGGAAAGTIGELPQHERFHWLVAPRSTIIQTSPCHSGLTDDPALELDRLFASLVKVGSA